MLYPRALWEKLPSSLFYGYVVLPSNWRSWNVCFLLSNKLFGCYWNRSPLPKSLKISLPWEIEYSTARRTCNLCRPYLKIKFSPCEIWGFHSGFPVSPLQPWRWRQYVSPKRWHQPKSLHGDKTQKNSIIKISQYLNNTPGRRFRRWVKAPHISDLSEVTFMLLPL
jgi:hypothetical protein